MRSLATPTRKASAAAPSASSTRWSYEDDTFHNEWQDYRTRKKRELALTTDWHQYDNRGKHPILVKVIDIFGNDTTRLLEVEV